MCFGQIVGHIYIYIHVCVRVPSTAYDFNVDMIS